MKSPWSYIVSITLCVLLIGCALEPRGVLLKEGAVLQPIEIKPLPSELGFQGSLTQVVTGRFGEQTDQLRFEVNISDEQLVLVGLTSVGIPAFSLIYDGHDTISRTHLPGVNLPDPAWILADFLLSNAPYAVLKPLLSAQNLDIHEGAEVRQITNVEGEVLIEIRYEDVAQPRFAQDLRLQNRRLGYDLLVKTALHNIRAD